MRKKLSKILVTGAAGFMGSEFVRQGVRKGHPVVCVDLLTYAGDLERLGEAAGRYKFYRADVRLKGQIEPIFKKEKPGLVVHFAAESHVDRSIHDALPFIKTNIGGTQVLLEASRKYHIQKLIHVSSDEVYGEIKKGKFNESSPLSPSSPYAASKASADFLVQACVQTHEFPAVIVRPSNNYGPWQYPEKFIPLAILNALKDRKVPVYGRGENIREWLFVSDCIRAIFCVLEKGRIGEIYNIGSAQERKNIDTAAALLGLLKKPRELIDLVPDRPGHDHRYALDCEKIRALGWKPRVGLRQGLARTVLWYRRNFPWLEDKGKSLKAFRYPPSKPNNKVSHPRFF